MMEFQASPLDANSVAVVVPGYDTGRTLPPMKKSRFGTWSISSVDKFLGVHRAWGLNGQGFTCNGFPTLILAAPSPTRN